MLDDLERFVVNYSLEYSILDINQAIECYNVCLFIDSGIRAKNWTDQFYQKFLAVKGTLQSNVARYFGTSLKATNFLSVARQVDKVYIKDFLVLITEFNIIDKIPGSEFIEAIRQKVFILYDVISIKKLVEYYDSDLRDVFLNDPQNAKLIINTIVPSNWKNENRLAYLPDSISNSEYEALIVSYINSPAPNPNYLDKIITYRNKLKIKLSDSTKYLAKNKSKEFEADFWKNNEGVSYSVSIEYKEQHELMKLDTDGLNHKISYDKRWVTENLDYPTILNNFIYFFEFVDCQMKINTIAKKSDTTSLLSLLSGLSDTDYPTYGSFYYKDQVTLLSLISYTRLLDEKDIDLKEVLKYYYQEHLKEYFGIYNFNVSFSVDQNYYEQCKSLASEIESIARQYQSYVNSGFIDHQYISLATSGITYASLPSLVKRKYIYSSSDKLEELMYLLFSDQSPLYFIANSGDDVLTTLSKEKIQLSDLERWQLEPMKRLIVENIIRNDLDGYLQLHDIPKSWILEELYDSGFLNYHNPPQEIREVLDEMLKRDLLRSESTLLARQESMYFNYILNRSEFGNSLDLRNRYSHGTGSRDATKNQEDYFRLLTILILLTIKINDDLETDARIQKFENASSK